MRILFVASESNPFVKTGGLADVTYSLAEELVSLSDDNQVSIIIPFYSRIKSSIFLPVDYLGEINVKMGWRNVATKVCKCTYNKIDFYFIENDYYFARDQIYGEGDDGERFAYFTLASIEITKHFDLQPDIVHIHDWQVGMFPCVTKVTKDPYFKKTKYIYTIHNPAFQGNYDPGFILSVYSLPSEVYDNGSIRLDDMVSTLKAGIMYSDKITTVSPTHREELLTHEGSKGLDGALELRRDDFVGILNGVDYREFNPSADKLIHTKYNSLTFFKGKQANKEELLNRFGIANKSLPVFGLVSRLTWQKGINLIIPTIDRLVHRGCIFVILGSGEYALEQEFEKIRARYPDKVGIYIGYNDALAHLIYAGNDFFLMPSLFEPCGLSQMISERYGTLPIVRMTGGLKDSVICFDNENKDTANGFGFAPNSVDEMIRTTEFAFDKYWDLPLRKQLIKNAMNTDNSWTTSAKKYYDLYKLARKTK